MHIRGAVHVHSTLSRDGTLSIAQLARYFKEKGYQFLAMGEHAEDLNDAKVQSLRSESAANSNETFCVVPGIEFAVTRQIHIVGVGVVNLIPLESPVFVAERIRAQGGMSILAHPKKLAWDCHPELLRAIDAAEIWNIGYDGKYLPSSKALPAFERMRQENPKLLAMASHDFHRVASFYGLAIEMEVAALSPNLILQELKAGRYRARSPLFNCESNGQASLAGTMLARHISSRLESIRKARLGFRRRTA